MLGLIRTQLFDTDGILKKKIENLYFEKNYQLAKKCAKLPSMQKVNL